MPMPRSEHQSRGRIRVRFYESPVRDPMSSPPRGERRRSHERTSRPSNSNETRQENRTNSYPAPPIGGQRNNEFDNSYGPAYNNTNPFGPDFHYNPHGYGPGTQPYSSNAFDPRFQYHNTNVFIPPFQPPYPNTFPPVVPPFAPSPPNPFASRYYQRPSPYPDHAPLIPSPQFDGSPTSPTAPRNGYGYAAEYQDIASSAGTVGSRSTSSTSSMEKEVKRMKRSLRRVRHEMNSTRRHEDMRREVARQLNQQQLNEQRRW